MFESFTLRPGSVATLAELMLSLVLTVYIASIKKKSMDTWLFLFFVGCSCAYYFIAFLYFSQPDIQLERGLLFWIHQVALTLFQLSILPFAYYFKGNPFKGETKVVFVLAPAIAVAALYLQEGSLPYSFLYFFVLAVWMTGVFVRKARISSHTAQPGQFEKGWENPFRENRSLKGNNENAALPSSSDRDKKAFLSFAYWGVLICIIWINVNLMSMRIMPAQVWNPLHNTLILISLVWLVTNYINYSGEHITLLVKLVALSLCAILLLLGVMGFILLPSEQNIALAYSIYLLRVLAFSILIATAVIVVVFPVFYKKNLLRPLDQVLAGVQKINEGKLQTNVPVEVNDEIGSLARHFNQMTESLRKYAAEMETLVAERTQKLEQSLGHLKNVQAQLVQQEKMASLGELTAGIAHEIQNPLNFVNNFSEVNTDLVEELKEQLATGNSQKAMIIAEDIKNNNQKIFHHGKRADSIIKGMLQHSRASTGKKELTNINELADEYLRLSYHGLRAKDKSFNATYKTHFDESIGKINIAPQDIGRVLLNLYNNAFYSVNEKKKSINGTFEPTVTVSTKKAGNTIEIRVKDNGTGIPQKVLDKIFQPFFTTKPTGEGTGLGLSLSYDIITKGHGGELKVETKEGEGAEFCILLPA